MARSKAKPAGSLVPAARSATTASFSPQLTRTRLSSDGDRRLRVLADADRRAERRVSRHRTPGSCPGHRSARSRPSGRPVVCQRKTGIEQSVCRIGCPTERPGRRVEDLRGARAVERGAEDEDLSGRKSGGCRTREMVEKASRPAMSAPSSGRRSRWRRALLRWIPSPRGSRTRPSSSSTSSGWTRTTLVPTGRNAPDRGVVDGRGGGDAVGGRIEDLGRARSRTGRGGHGPRR